MRTSLVIPFSIIIAGILVAGGVYSYFHARAAHPAGAAQDLTVIRPVDATDHILGNPSAPVKFVEYSDIDCPFCKNFKATMETLMASYGASGEVAWVYRHLPITTQHPSAEMHAEAAECVAAEGGTSAFFRFIDAINDAAPGAAQFNPSGYVGIVEKLGLDTDAFNACLENHAYKKRVEDDANNALAAGAGGVPYTVVLIDGQAPFSISGAFSLDQMKQIVDAALQKAGAKP